MDRPIHTWDIAQGCCKPGGGAYPPPGICLWLIRLGLGHLPANLAVIQPVILYGKTGKVPKLWRSTMTARNCPHSRYKSDVTYFQISTYLGFLS